MERLALFSIFLFLALSVGAESAASRLRVVILAQSEFTDIAGLDSAVAEAVWNQEQTAAFVAIRDSSPHALFVVLLPSSGDAVLVDVSRIESQNIGKLGVARSAEYDAVISDATEWVPRLDGLLQVEVRTQAWKEGKRQAALEKVVVSPDGRVLWR
jgi:hypothetical protein